jgi:acyl-coenzyme A synthetase/AMP-(fatty) acid ligase
MLRDEQGYFRRPDRRSLPLEGGERRDQRRCKDSLAAHKVPAVIRFVERLDVTEAGKLVRADA